MVADLTTPLDSFQSSRLLTSESALRHSCVAASEQSIDRPARLWLAQHPRFVLHFTPTSSSWINLVERWFAELTTKLLKRGQHRSVRQLNAEIRDWIDTWNENPRPYVWTKTADQILDSIKRYCQRINRTAH